jgi:hypothetical protein
MSDVGLFLPSLAAGGVGRGIRESARRLRTAGLDPCRRISQACCLFPGTDMPCASGAFVNPGRGRP